MIPMTINQLAKMLEVTKKLKEQGLVMKKEHIAQLYNDCSNLTSFDNSSEWPKFVEARLDNWKEKLLAS
jgi:hypothetical protein